MKRWLIVLMLLMLMTAVFLPAALAETVYISGATADRVHLRAAPMADAASLGLYFTGAPAERLATLSDGWSRVRVGSETGYILTEYVSDTASQAFPLCVVDNRTSDWVNLRSGASFDADPVGRLNNGDQVRLMGETASGWSYVEAEDQRGYVVTDFLAAAEESSLPDVDAPAGPAMTTFIVGVTGQGDYIHMYQPYMGRAIYFVAQDEQPFITLEDVNFDGYDDLVVATIRGATNCYYEFFLWTDAGYVMAGHPGVEGIANYVLYPQQGFVLSSANSGNAGAMYEDCLFCWDGTDLHLLRRASAQSLKEYRSEGASFVTVLHDRKIDLSVYAYSIDGDVTLLHAEVVDLNDMDTEKLEEMKQRLWEGLR